MPGGQKSIYTSIERTELFLKKEDNNKKELTRLSMMFKRTTNRERFSFKNRRVAAIKQRLFL